MAQKGVIILIQTPTILGRIVNGVIDSSMVMNGCDECMHISYDDVTNGADRL